MSTTKAALKAIASSIQSSKFDDAAQQAEQLLAKEPQNYQANLFLGFALDKQGKLLEAEKAYHSAKTSKPDDAQAWQGLIKLFEKQGANKLDAYQDSAAHLSTIYGRLDDRYKCQDVVDKFIAFAKLQGTRQQERESLRILLPDNPVYEFLEGRIPHPGLTYEKIAQLTEADEKERTNKEIGERRTRLGAKIGQVTLEVKREILKDSPLLDTYQKVIDWTTDDSLRRLYEEKLFLRCYDALVVAPVAQKENERVHVQKLAHDMVIIKHPFKLAWDVALEWQDHALIDSWDPNILREYISFFPESGLAKLLKGFMTSEVSPFPPTPPTEFQETPPKEDDDTTDDDDEYGGAALDAPLTIEDRLLMMADGVSEAPTSILGHRIMGQYYAFLDEHQAVVELARSGLQLIQSESQKTGLLFKNAHESLSTQLATGLVYYQSPKNHPEAKAMFEGILILNPSSTSALIGVGLIFEEEEDFPAAIDFLERALHRDSSNIRVRAEAAWVRALNGDYDRSAQELEVCLQSMDGTDLRTRDLRAQTQYRIGVCIWNVDTSVKARKDRGGAYAYFLAALKSNLNYAPAYTSLGIYYSDYSKDKKRARKCFQKAFELSASEVEAAERLARVFAEQGEWDLVEVVSQRVVDSGKVRPAPGSKKQGFSWPFAALGIAELNKQDYTKSIVSFQSALRITPKDYHSWVGLGESYHNSGRYVAATRAFTHAEQFEHLVQTEKSGETWFAKYMLANVKRELGDYEDAIDTYKEVLGQRSQEFGVSIALVQTLVERAWDSTAKGLIGQAARLAKEAIHYAQPLVTEHSDAFNLWKGLGDACSVFSWVQSKLSDFPHEAIKQAISSVDDGKSFTVFSEVDAVGSGIVCADGRFPDDEQDGLDMTRCLQAAILCHKRALYTAASDVHAQAVAYYNLGWTEYRTHICLAPALQKKATRYQKAAVRCFKRSIELEAGNSEFWNALGVVTSEHAPKIAQHAFVRSLYLNERSAHAWTNLGVLYLLQNDVQLAHEVFNRAQSTDPDFAHAWIGQGLVALLYDDPKEARLLFTHAMEIADSSAVITSQQYTLATFDHIISSTVNANVTDLIQPIFALNQLGAIVPGELPYQQLASLFLERATDVAAAVATLNTVCTKVEADFEITESPVSMSHFALAKADLARCQLADGFYDLAIENADTSLELSAEDAGNDLSEDARRKCRLSAHLTLGLGSYHTGELSQAVEYLEAAIGEAMGNPDCACLLAQILWATGNQESRDKARDQLFNCIEHHPGHVQSVLLLGTVALLDGDMESLEAVTTDLDGLRFSATTTDEEQASIGELKRAIAALSDGHSEQATLTQVQSEVFLFPYHPHGWERLATMESSDMARKAALRAVPPKGDLDAADLATALAGAGSISDAQQAIFAAPWCGRGWNTMTAIVEGAA